MGIKVEHQGNATSRIVGANVGGNAKAREERASAAAQRSAYAFAAGNRQLGGAHASGAQTGHTQAQLGHASASLIAPPKYTPLEDSHLVTKDRVDDRQEWDRDRQAWVRRYDSGEELDRILGITGTHKAALDRNTISNDDEKGLLGKLRDVSLMSTVNYDYAPLGQNTTAEGNASGVTTPYGLTNPIDVNRAYYDTLYNALAYSSQKRRQYLGYNNYDFSTRAPDVSKPQSSSFPAINQVQNPLSGYDFSLKNGYSVGVNASNPNIWGLTTGGVLRDGRFDF